MRVCVVKINKNGDDKVEKENNIENKLFSESIRNKNKDFCKKITNEVLKKECTKVNDDILIFDEATKKREKKCAIK